MATHHLGCDDTFAMLSTPSQRVNRKLRDLAGDIVANPPRPERARFQD